MANMPGMAHGTHAMAPGPLGIPQSRLGSGTSWLPDAAPMHAEHLMAGSWQFMLHYQVFVDYDRQVSDRAIDGNAQLNSINWFMGMASHPLGDGRLAFRGMVSAEPATVGAAGYPLLLQSGETYRDRPIHDRQHPHDLFMELAALYDVPLSHDLALQLYAAPVGEPAVGPPAFPHRSSAAADPMAPLGHHWQDATHVTFGVLTAGLYTRTVKLEGSVFNGREPDATRTNFDFRTLDSYAGRITVNPAEEWSASASYAYLKSPEVATPNIAQHRITASVLNDHPLASGGTWSTALIYGANLDSDDPRLSNSVDLETTVDLDGRNSLFGRVEYVNKSAGDLALPGPPDARFDLGSASVGYTRDIARLAGIAMGLGGVLTLDLIPPSLVPHYGTRTPGGIDVFLRFRPADRHRLTSRAP